MNTNLSILEDKYKTLEDFILLADTIKKIKPKSILLQFPEGLKPYSTSIVREIKEIAKKTLNREVEIRIWLGSCFGACDLPNSKPDLLVQFGHAPWNS
jgi:2-(3-amino-3-carboxypropyl)histidine synthase